ncbi:MAG: pseudouridine synthase [Candidatus Berkiella sp.]
MSKRKHTRSEDEEWSLHPPEKLRQKPTPRAPKRSPSSINARTRSGIPVKSKRTVKEARSAVSDEPMRIQKFLANNGVASRRAIEEWIKAGKVTVNKAKATLGQSVSACDTIIIDGKKLYLKAFDKQETRVLLYHKPEGELCAARSENGKPTIFESLPQIKGSKWVMVGRLDINTSGLLLLTNNGKLAHHLMHPSFALERQYAVRVLGKVTEDILENLTSGVRIDNELFRFQSVTFGGGTGANQWYHVTLSEGKYREVRRLWESQGCKVNRLIRTQYGPYVLPNGLRKGKYFELSSDEVAELLSESGL